jgi:hypothetical protein
MNPISQLFALRVEEIPGYRPGTKGEPEQIVQELIFTEALGLCDRRSRITFASEKLGCVAKPVERRTPAAPQAQQPPQPPKKQVTINSFFLDTLMVKKREKESKNGNTVIVEA